MRKMVNQNVLKLGRQISEIAKKLGTVTPVLVQKNGKQNDRGNLGDLEKLGYAISMYGHKYYVPSKHIKFDRFFQAWIFMARRLFMFHNTTEDKKINNCIFNMQNVALKCFLWMESSKYLMIWPEFVKSLLKKFNPITYTFLCGKLSKIHYKKLAVIWRPFREAQLLDYGYQKCCHQKMSCLELGLGFVYCGTQATKVVRVPNWILLEMFESGWKVDIQKKVIRAKLVDLQEAMELAIHLEIQGGSYKIP